jgi:purine catabolism regulator
VTLTLGDVARELELPVLAGAQAVDVPLRWVHISELEDPTPWLSGGELLLTTGMALHDAEAQRRYVDVLVGHGVAGVGFGVGFDHDEVPAALLEAAARAGLPLLEVPYATPFIAVTELAFSRLVNAQYAALQQSIAVQERLTRIVLDERGLDALVGAIAGLVGGSVLVFDGRGAPLARRAFRRDLADADVAVIAEALRRRARAETFVPGPDLLAARALALPVPAPGAARDGRPQAWLVAVKDDGGLAEADRLVLHQAVTVVALELQHRHAAETTEQRLAGDVLREVVEGRLAGAELARRLAPFGLEGRVSALVLAPGRRTGGAEALAGALRDEALPGVVAASGQLTVALLPELGEDDLVEVAQRLRERVGRTLGGEPPPAGAGRAVAAGDARRALHEARCALEARVLGARANGDGRAAMHAGVATHHDLGSFQLLLSLQDSDALRLFCDALLAPIEAGEGHYGGELLRSLEAFIEANGQWETAAKRLFCHRHTLRYRIRKIEELTGRDLSSAKDRIEFWLALRGRELVR